MLSRKQVAHQLREAATEIQNLTNDKAALETEKAELLQKIAALEEQTKQPHKEEFEAALQKEADEGFSFRGGNGFGSSADDLPTMSSDLSAEQRLDMILSGESPSDFE
jgi:hypothetical protein